jgi:hypothetical protein
MPFSVPEFPVVAAIWGPNAAGDLIFRLTAPCNVAVGRRVTSQADRAGALQFQILHFLLFPRGTDVRDGFMHPATGADFIEVPEGSQRWYVVASVSDLGQGFENEHRVALAVKGEVGGAWPEPLPPVFGGPPARRFDRVTPPVRATPRTQVLA